MVRPVGKLKNYDNRGVSNARSSPRKLISMPAFFTAEESSVRSPSY